MLTRLITASALAGGLLMVMLQAPAQALPVAKTDAAKSSTVTLVGHRGGGGGGGRSMGGGGGGRGFAMRGGGGGGPRFHGGGGGGPKFAFRGGGGPRFQGGGGGPRFAYRGGGGPRFQGGGGSVPRFAYRGGGGPKAWKGRKFAGDFKHHRFNKGHRRFRGYAIYGVPYVYGYGGYGGCEWLYRRAIATGSPYWWDRYYACRDGYYDY